MIRFTCPNCQEKFKVDDKYAGRKAKCSACEQSILVPDKSEHETDQDTNRNGPPPIKSIPPPDSSIGFFGGRFERIDGVVVKVENRVASIGTKGLGAGFSVPIEDLGISVGTGLAGSKSKVERESVVWVKQEDQKETRFVFGGETFPCREGNRIAIGLIGRGVLVAKNFATNQKVIINKPESFYRIDPPEFRGRFYGLLAAFFFVWFLSLGVLGARSVPYGTYKPPITQAIDSTLLFFVCLSPIVVPVIIFIVVSKKSRQFYKLEHAKQSKELKDIINNF
jgi:predicted Zn finger-like uncharacterized protein